MRVTKMVKKQPNRTSKQENEAHEVAIGTEKTTREAKKKKEEEDKASVRYQKHFLGFCMG